MKRVNALLFLISGLILAASCVSQDDIRNLQNQIDHITDTHVKSIEQQISNIQVSITELQKTDNSLQVYIADLTKTVETLQKSLSETDSKLEAARQEFDRAISDAKAEAAADNTALKNELVKSLETAKADVLAQLTAARTELQNQIDGINSAIETLKAKDAELETKIADLKTYVDGQNKDTRDWASATFVTIDQYNSTVATVASIQQTIEGLNASVDAIETRIETVVASEVKNALEPLKNEMISEVVSAVTSDYTNAIADAKAETEAAYTKAIAEAISALESSLKSWVNAQFANYYTAAQTDSKLQVLKNEFESQLSAQKAYLESMIKSLDSKLEGEISTNESLIETLRNDLTTAQEGIAQNADAIAASSSLISANSGSIASNASSISANATAIGGLESKIDSLESEMNEKITELQSGISETENSIESINAEIESIKSDYAAKIETLKEELTKLTEANTELIKSNKALIESNASEIAANKSSIASLKAETESAISDNAKAISANAEAIAENAEAIAENASLISANAAAISNNSNAIASNAADISKLRADMESSMTELTAAYKAAIKSAIETSEGKITAQIASEVATINSRIDEELASVNNTITALAGRVTACEKDIKNIKSQILDIQSDIEEMQGQLSAILSRIQSVSYVPKYSDGKATMTYTDNNGTITPGVAVLDFEIHPSSAAADLVKVWQSAISVSAVYTITRSAPDVVPLTIKTVTEDKGYITVTVSGNNLSEDFFSGNCSANVRMKISDGNNELATDYIPVVPGVTPVRSITLNKSSAFLIAGQTVTLKATVDVDPAYAPYTTIIWSTSAPSVATVTNGVVTAKMIGDAIITARAGNKTATCAITVADDKGYADLSDDGTANCYLVSMAGDYKFKAVKGNSDVSVGDVATADVLWESFGTKVKPAVGALISSASFSDGYIHFSTPKTFANGNAVIAAKDSKGNILWSWHIWCSKEGWKNQVYRNNAGIMMDRNLGATSATPGSVGALGLLYQWGRKDPFLGSSSISGRTKALSTGTWSTTVSSTTKITNEFVVKNPMVFCKSPDNDLPYDNWSSKKTIYDPCPAGWRVPDGGSNGVWATAFGTSSSWWTESNWDSKNRGMNFSSTDKQLGNAGLIWYPASGYLVSSDGGLDGSGSYGNYWSVTPNGSSYAFYLSFYGSGSVDPVDSYGRWSGFSVRCLQE